MLAPLALMSFLGSTANVAMVQSIPLEGTQWRAIEIAGKPTPTQDPKREAHLLFQPEGRVSGSDGCNRLMGSYQLKGDAVTFGELSSTMMLCMNTRAIERAFRDALKGATRLKVIDDQMELFDSADKRVAMFRAGAQPTGPAAGQHQSSISIEIEDLLSSAKVSGGQTGRQDMRSFGRGWSGNAQLFWGAPAPVDKPIRNWPHLSVWFGVPSANTYELVLHYTSAPDFGTFRVFLDGQSRADVDAYSPAVTPQNRSLGQHKLSAGKHELLVTVFSKAGGSKGFSVGLDRIELRPSGTKGVPREPQHAPRETEAKGAEAPNALSTLYTVEVLSFKPAMFPDRNRWGCVVIVKNPYASSLPRGAVSHPLSGYEPGEHCGKALTAQSSTLTTWDYIFGWAKAYEIVSQFYDEAKVWTATQFADTLPCDMLRKAPSDCKKYAEQLAGAAINVGLASAGVPPSLPELNAATQGQAVEVGVGFTCSSIEASGGKCTPHLRAALAKAYGAGLDKLVKELDRTTKEPGCGNSTIASQHGRKPLPCFGDYPDVEFRPADGAVYQPPVLTVRVTRTGLGLPELQRSGYELRAELMVRNTFPGGQIESCDQAVPQTDLSGELFAPATLTLPFLAMGESATVMLQMGGIKEYAFSSAKGGHAKHNGWCALYNGGTGSVTVAATCRNSSGAPVSCAAPARRAVQMPKDSKCAVVSGNFRRDR